MNPPFYCLQVLGRMKTHNGGSNGVYQPKVCRKTFALPDCMRILFEKNYRPIHVEFSIFVNLQYAAIACHCSLLSLVPFHTKIPRTIFTSVQHHATQSFHEVGILTELTYKICSTRFNRIVFNSLRAVQSSYALNMANT